MSEDGDLLVGQGAFDAVFVPAEPIVLFLVEFFVLFFVVLIILLCSSWLEELCIEERCSCTGKVRVVKRADFCLSGQSALANTKTRRNNR